MNDQDFFVGYQPKQPESYAKRSRTMVVLLFISTVVVMALIALAQKPLNEGSFAFGTTTSYEGIVYTTPISYLGGEGESYLLVNEFKFGPPDVVRESVGKKVIFDGTLVQGIAPPLPGDSVERKGVSMIEMNTPDSFQVIDDDSDEPRMNVYRFSGFEPKTLKGEIVDTKCYLGVMKPGMGKVHRGCAVRCLSGGIPPGLRVIEDHGEFGQREKVYLLAPMPGESLDLDPQLAGITVEVTGVEEWIGGLPVLRVSSIGQ